MKTYLFGELEPLTDIESDNDVQREYSGNNCNGNEQLSDSINTGCCIKTPTGRSDDNDISGRHNAYDSDSDSSFPEKLRTQTCGEKIKLKRLRAKANAAEKKFGGFRIAKSQDWSIDDALILSTGFQGDCENAKDIPSKGMSPEEHLANLEKSGYKKITLG
jgi:hypothetical protein